MEVTLGARGVALGVVGAAATGAVVAILLGAAGGGWLSRWGSWAVGGGEHRPRAKWRLPSRIILLRHGQSLGNVKESAYRVIPDWQIPLTEHGKMQARLAAAKIVEMIGDEQVVIYYSPYTRVLQTLDPLLEAVPPGQLLSVQEEPRIREQDFGNYQDSSMKDIKKERVRFGRFFYRFPEGESVADVYDRISSFFETIFRQFKRSPICNLPPEKDFALVIVSHGITLRLFIMRWFLWTVKDFEKMKNPPNCHPITLVRRDNKGHHYEMDHESQGRLGVTSTMPSTGQYQLPLHYTPHWYS